MILSTEHVSSLEDIAIKYINHLLERHAMDQHMPANQRDPDERLMARMSEVRAKNTELEMTIQGLRRVVQDFEHTRAQWLAEATSLREKIDALESANLYLSNQFQAARKREDDLLAKNHVCAQGSPVGVQGSTDAPRTKAQGTDGDAVLRDGKAALARYLEAARQPQKGE